LPATEFCPFKIEGVLELLPTEDNSLQSGSSTTAQVTNPDGTVSTVTLPANQANLCPHTIEFMSTPGWEAIVEQQRNEILIRDIEAQQQAAMEAQQQGLENPQAPPAEQPVQEPAPPAPEAQPEVTPQPPEETPAE